MHPWDAICRYHELAFAYSAHALIQQRKRQKEVLFPRNSPCTYSHGGGCAGKLQGFGFVQFDTEEAVDRACQMEDTTLMGRELYINASTAPAAAQPTGPVPDCWFCLSSSAADVGLVASIGTFSSPQDAWPPASVSKISSI